jgi:hypothetical protein
VGKNTHTGTVLVLVLVLVSGQTNKTHFREETSFSVAVEEAFLSLACDPSESTERNLATMASPFPYHTQQASLEGSLFTKS